MRTNVELDDQLVEEAFAYSKNIRTKRKLIETALREYVDNRKMKDLRELRGQIDFYEEYD